MVSAVGPGIPRCLFGLVTYAHELPFRGQLRRYVRQRLFREPMQVCERLILSTKVPTNARVEALSALSTDQMKRLKAYARILSWSTGEEDDDLLHRAFERWLTSDEPCEGPEQTYQFLRGAIKSIRFNILRHANVVRRKEGTRAVAEPGGEDPLDQAPDAAGSAEGALFVQQLYDLCESDDDMRLLLMARYDNATRAEIQAELGWDDTKYETVMKRKKRLIARWTIEGKLQ